MRLYYRNGTKAAADKMNFWLRDFFINGHQMDMPDDFLCYKTLFQANSSESSLWRQEPGIQAFFYEILEKELRNSEWKKNK